MSQDNQNTSSRETTEKNRSVFFRILGPWTFFILLVVAAAVLYLRSAGDEQDMDEFRERPPVAVQIAPVVDMTLSETVRGVGSLRPIQSVEIRPEAAGRIKAVHFQEGGFVSRNKLLFEIEEQRQVQRVASSRATLDQAETRLDNLRRNYDRIKTLYEQNLVSRDEYERVRTELDSASSEVARLEAQLDLAREDLGDTLIRAPFSGFISGRLVDPGAYVSLGQLLAVMYQTDSLEISFMTPERYSAEVRLGQEVMVEVSAYPGQRFRGEVNFVSPSVDESTRNFEVKAFIANPENRLRPGSFASAVLVLGYREAALVIPERSLVATRDGYIVFVADSKKEQVESRRVSIGGRRPGMVEIVEGLSHGEHVVVTGHMNLSHGFRISVVEEADHTWVQAYENYL
jgi:membrane fusion protein (multidrug efflux system)